MELTTQESKWIDQLSDKDKNVIMKHYVFLSISCDEAEKVLKLKDFEFVRVKDDETGYYVSQNWENRNYTFGQEQKEKDFYYKFNPENALNEINEVGFDEYKGQLFYFKEDKKSIYPD